MRGRIKEKNSDMEKRIGYLERIVKVSQILNSTLSLQPLLQLLCNRYRVNRAPKPARLS